MIYTPRWLQRWRSGRTISLEPVLPVALNFGQPAAVATVEPLVACPECGSLDVRAERMVGINDESIMSDWTGAFECGDCEFQTRRFDDFRPADNLGLSPALASHLLGPDGDR